MLRKIREVLQFINELGVTATIVTGIVVFALPYLASMAFLGQSNFFQYVTLSAVAVILVLIWFFVKRLQREEGARITPIIPIYNPSDRPDISDRRDLIEKNRADDIKKVSDLLERAAKAVIISGVKGVGKSTLAAFLADENDFWVSFDRKSADLSALLIMAAQWLGDEEIESVFKGSKDIGVEHIKHLCDRLIDKERRLYFDNLETLLDEEPRAFKDDSVSQFFKTLISSSHKCQIVITSRLKPCIKDKRELAQLGGVYSVDLGGLKDQDGAELLKKGGVAVEDESVLEDFSKGVDGNPLLLKILPPLVMRPGGDKYIENPELWKKFFTKEGFDARLLGEAAQEGMVLIYRLSVFPDAVNLAGVKFLCGDDIDGEFWACELVNRSLLEWNREDNSYRLHPAVAETALNELRKKPGELRNSRKRAANMYILAACSLKPPDEWKSLEDCQPLLRALEQMIELDDFANAAPLLVNILNDPLDRWGHWRLLGCSYERLIEIWRSRWWKARRRLKVYGQVVRNYGIMLYSLGDYSGATERHREHLRISRRIKDRHEEGAAYAHLGLAHHALGEYHKAIEFHEKCSEIMKETDDRYGEGGAYGNLGIAYDTLGEYDKAIEFHEKNLEVAKEIGDRRREGGAYGNLGIAYNALGKYEKAIEFHEKCSEIMKETDDRHGESNAYGNLGSVYGALGEYDKANEFHEKALAIDEEIGNKRGVGEDYGNLGIAYYSLGEYDKAIEFSEKRLKIALEIGDRLGEGNAYGTLGIAYHSLGEYDKAIEFNEKHLKIALEIGDRRGEGSAYGNLGIAHHSLGEYDKAIEFHKKCLEIMKDIGDRRGEGNAYGNLGNAYAMLEKYDKAVDYHQRAVEILEQIGYLDLVATHRLNSAIDYKLLGDLPKAVPHAVLGLLVAKKIKIPEAGRGLALVRECREQLGEERFREVAVESVGEEGADAVEEILAQAEEAMKSKEDEPPSEDHEL